MTPLLCSAFPDTSCSSSQDDDYSDILGTKGLFYIFLDILFSMCIFLYNFICEY